jgi:putative serine protease PepD
MSAATSRFLPIIGGAVAGGAIALAVAGGSSTKTVTTTVIGSAGGTSIPASVSRGAGMTVNQISKVATPGVVDIKVTATQQLGNGGGFFGGSATQQTQGEGAGVVYDMNGDILTDEHVVDGATAVTITFSDGHSYPAKVVGTDKSTDVGVVRVSAPSSELHPLPLADSSAAQVGDDVVAIGSPFGLPGTVTAGIVSATGRSIQAPNQYTISDAIQTDAAINQGNSGGPLLDASAHVLGLNDQIETNSGASAGVGFAVPSNTVKQVADGIIAGHPVKHAYVGISLVPNAGGATGATVGSVSAGGPASSAGIRTSDVITAVNSTAITSTDQFIQVIDGYPPGRAVTLTIQRGGSTKNISVTLGVRPPTAP